VHRLIHPQIRGLLSRLLVAIGLIVWQSVIIEHIMRTVQGKVHTFAPQNPALYFLSLSFPAIAQ